MVGMKCDLEDQRVVGEDEGKEWAKAHNSMCEKEFVCVYHYICLHVHDIVHGMYSVIHHSALLAGFYSDATVKNRAALQEPFVRIASCLSSVGERTFTLLSPFHIILFALMCSCCVSLP